jgi:RNA polymerase sigma factor (sigma-70 family)
VSDDPGPTAECLERRIPELREFLRRNGFHWLVIERAIDRVIRAALRYLDKDEDCTLNDRVSWLFGSALAAARQVAQRELPCVYAPTLLAMVPTKSEDEQAQAVWDALDALTERQRLAAYYRVMREFTLEETAAEMGLSVCTVRYHCQVALERLRELLAPPGR